MRKYLTLIIFFTSICCQGQSLVKITWDGTMLRRYFSIDGDEFNELTLDRNKWDTRYPWGRTVCNTYSGQNEIQYYTDGLNHNLWLGNLSLTAKEETVTENALGYGLDTDLLCDGQPNRRTFNYTSGMLFSNRKFRYGLFEINAKLPSGKGLFPAFWLYGDNYEEIDIFEYKGECPSMYQVNVHWQESGYPSWISPFAAFFRNLSRENGWWVPITGNLDAGFNTYRVNWEYNDFLQFSFNQGVFGAFWWHTFQHPLNLIVNVALGKEINEPLNGCPSSLGSEIGPDQSGTPNSNFPTSMEIDWIRIWKPLDCQSNVIVCNYPSGLIDPSSITGEIVTIGGTNCSNYISPNEGFDVAAITEINILGETTISGYATAQIVTCPNVFQAQSRGANTMSGKEFEFVYNSAGDLIDDKDKLLNIDSLRKPNFESKDVDSHYIYNLWPNPSQTGFFKLTIYNFNSKLVESKNIEIYNELGSLISNIGVIKFIDDSYNIDLSKYKSGVYSVKIILSTEVKFLKFVRL